MPDARTTALDDRVLATLREHGPASPLELGLALGLDRYPVREALERLRRRKLARPVGVTGAGRTWGITSPLRIWEATPAG